MELFTVPPAVADTSTVNTLDPLTGTSHADVARIDVKSDELEINLLSTARTPPAVTATATVVLPDEPRTSPPTTAIIDVASAGTSSSAVHI